MIVFSTTSDYQLRQMPNNNAEYDSRAKVITSLFVGDPSFFAFNGDETEAPASDDPEAKPVEIFREINRLSFTVKVISCLLHLYLYLNSINA